MKPMVPRYSRENYSQLYEEINRIFRELLRYDPAAERVLETMVTPPVDIFETPREIVMEMEIPGADPNRIKVTYEGGRIHIEGEKKELVSEGRQNYICMERTFGYFQRVIPINQAVNLKESRAFYRQGILCVKFPKISEKRGESVTITVSGNVDSEETP